MNHKRHQVSRRIDFRVYFVSFVAMVTHRSGIFGLLGDVLHPKHGSPIHNPSRAETSSLAKATFPQGCGPGFGPPVRTGTAEISTSRRSD